MWIANVLDSVPSDVEAAVVRHALTAVVMIIGASHVVEPAIFDKYIGGLAKYFDEGFSHLSLWSSANAFDLFYTHSEAAERPRGYTHQNQQGLLAPAFTNLYICSIQRTEQIHGNFFLVKFRPAPGGDEKARFESSSLTLPPTDIFIL